MKILRILFNTNNRTYAIDRLYNEEQTEPENCNEAMNVIMQGMEKGSVVPGLELAGTKSQKGTPVILNLGQLDIITVLSMGTYESNTPAPSEPQQEAPNENV